MTVIFLALLATQAGDWWTTRTILALGGYEKNPLIRWLMERTGIGLALGIKTVAVIAIGLVLLSLPWPFLAALTAYYAWIVVANYRVVRRLRARA